MKTAYDILSETMIFGSDRLSDENEMKNEEARIRGESFDSFLKNAQAALSSTPSSPTASSSLSTAASASGSASGSPGSTAPTTGTPASGDAKLSAASNILSSIFNAAGNVANAVTSSQKQQTPVTIYQPPSTASWMLIIGTAGAALAVVLLLVLRRK